MPCPYFEPQQIARNGQDIQGRLPLFDEYDGVCHATSPSRKVPSAFRFSGCNHGHPDSGCKVFPAEESCCHRRFHISEKTKADEPTLEILVLEIENHTPVCSYSVLYSKANEHIEPEVQDECERAQILAFCRSFLRRVLPSANLKLDDQY